MMHKLNFALALLFILFFVGMQSLFTINEGSQALVLRFGQPMGEVKGPGLHVKIPFIETVRIFDKRILAVDPPPTQFMIAASTTTKAEADRQGKEPLLVDTFMRYRITDPLRFMSTLKTEVAARATLTNILLSEVRAEMGRTTLTKLLSAERTQVMQTIGARVSAQMKAARYGVELVDVRLVRADLTPELLTSTIQRMRSSFKEQATQTRAEGEEAALKIKANADRQKTVILANAERTAQGFRGTGDKEATQIYAEAFNKDPEFYALWRSMEAYRKALANPDMRLVLSPEDVAFFKAFRQGSGNP